MHTDCRKMALCKLEQKSAGSVSIRHMLLAVEYDRVMGHDQISLPTVSLRHDSLCDIKGYQHFLEAEGKGINLVDAGHFPTEDPICGELAAYLQTRFPQLRVMKSAVHREVIQYFVEGE